MNRLFIIDGHNMAYRAYYAVKALSTTKGISTNAVYGVTHMLLKLLRDEQALQLQEAAPIADKKPHMVVVFDTPAPTFRHKQYPEYKATRKPMPEDMRPQMELIKQVISGFNIPVITQEGYEADDIMATIATKCQDMVDEVVLVTADKDILQMVNEKIVVQTSKKGISDVVIYRQDNVHERLGVLPEYIADFLGLTGDSADNIPGVPGIGEKTAQSLIQEFGHIEKIFANLDHVSEKIRNKLERAKDIAFLSKQLVLLKTDVPLEIKFDDYAPQDMDREKLFTLFSELEFKSILEELGLGKKENTNYQIITSSKLLIQLVDTLHHQQGVAISLQMMTTKLIGIAISYEPMGAFYIPCSSTGFQPVPFHYGQDAHATARLDKEEVLNNLRPIMENASIKKYCHDIKSMRMVLQQYGINLAGIEFDTMLASYLLNSSTKHDLESIAFNYLGMTKACPCPTANEMDPAILGEYACSDADTIYRLTNVLTLKLEENGLTRLFWDIEMPSALVLTLMEANGIRVNPSYLGKLSLKLGARIKELEKEIYLLTGSTFNINSPKQLGVILFEKMQLPVIKKTKTGYATDEDSLNELIPYHPLPALILEYRGIAKLKSTYIDNLFELINPITKRVHTTYNQAVTTTGRLSSSNPNLQNIPIRTELGKSIRGAFIPEEGYLLLSADYSQIELRILAHIARDTNLLDAFIHDIDVHSQTAARIYDCDMSMITQDMRRVAKVVNFGIIYGMSAYGLSQELKIPPKKAQEMIDKYFNTHSGVKAYINSTIEQATRDGFVTTLWGRKRYIPELKSGNKNIREFGQRAAINMPIQGSAADLIKSAMINISKQIDNKRVKLLLQVHDELVFEVKQDIIKETSNLVKECMENAAKFSVPLKVDINYSNNWGEI
ncbi:DNA polymerase I [Candidatus Desantisbacteria bacterium CG2_30_40_21]|nr:MAG: DNA polymerase I [Candidatus Desantisbacteria bacterium CG2_30_40_21]